MEICPFSRNLRPGDRLNDVRALHEHEQRELKVVRQIDAHSVSRWRSEAKTPRYCLILEQDRNHRRAVCRQHNAARRATNWYAKAAPLVLENHQQRVEDIKSGTQTMLTRYSCKLPSSEVASKLSSSCSSAMNDTAAFVSSAFIAPRHDEVEQEKSHIMHQKAEYKNPVDGFRTARPLLGLETVELFRIIQQVIES
ncbi:hypothetical protein M408DRAFT_30074 [Serendipita vermifera MAFF 305830]|uniref:Uncharacterized protein n=1 Tax=Serendipita vermifera MAFF 305830 TaxID=933852 RepID=A0A0C3A853_SERVB|nr:hypothetical protein M408DRAFT_30074 [Serendipita vermifera MAFF 305830]